MAGEGVSSARLGVLSQVDRAKQYKAGLTVAAHVPREEVGDVLEMLGILDDRTAVLAAKERALGRVPA